MNNIKFDDLGLKESLLKAIKDMGFEEPSQIQAESIPVALEGHDIIGQAQTGTGKRTCKTWKTRKTFCFTNIRWSTNR